MERLDKLMASAVATRVFPGAVLRVAYQRRLVYEKSFGAMDYDHGQPVEVSTVFDLASLTKPLATAPAIMLLMQSGALTLSSVLADLIPGYDWGEKAGLTIVQLLTHTSGLPDYRPYYLTLKDMPLEQRGQALNELLVREPLINTPGTRVCYSDIGFMILAWVVETLSGMPLSVFAENRIYGPLKINELYYIRRDDVSGRAMRCAPTEFCPWRKKLIQGEVHDDNVWVMGGEGGHAGLFGTARGIDRLLCEFMKKDGDGDENPMFKPSVQSQFLNEWDHTGRTPGFDMPSPEGSSSGKYFSASSVGHLGFTGTSFWMDKEKGLTVILLTNRVHPSRENTAIKLFRPSIHDTVMECLGAPLAPGC